MIQLLKNLVANLPHTLEIYTLFFCMVAIVVIVGRRITALLPTELNEKYGFYLAPICGLSVLLQISIIYGWLHPYVFSISLSLVLFLLFCCLALERQFKNCLTDILKTYGFAVVCSLPILYLIIFYNGYNHGTDSITYLSQAQWLQVHSFKELGTVSPFYPANSAIIQYQHQGSRMGASFLLGFFQSLFNQQWSYYIYLPVTSLAFVAGCLAIGSFIRQIVMLEKSVMFALCLIPAFSYNGFVYGAKWGFYPMTNGLAFAVSFSSLLSMLSVYFFSLQQRVKYLSLVTLPLALLTSGFLLAYNEPFPIFLMAIGLFFIVLFFKYPEQRKFLMKFVAIYLLELIVLTNYEFVRIYKNLFLTLSIAKTSAGTGWPFYWWPTQFANFSLGLKMPISVWKLKSGLIASLVFPTVFFTIFYWCKKAWKENQLAQIPLVLLMVLELAFILAFIKFRYFSPANYPGEVGLSFLQFKVAKYASPFSLVFLAASLGLIFKHFEVFKKEFLLAYMVVFILSMNLQIFIRDECAHRDFMDNRMRVQHSPYEVFLKLRTFLVKNNLDTPVYVEFGPEYSKLKELVALSLQDRKMLTDYRDDGYLAYGLSDKQIKLKPWPSSPVLIMENTPYVKANQVFEFHPLKLILPPYQYVSLESKEGVSKTKFEADGRIIDWSDLPEMSHTYHSFGAIKHLKLHFQIDVTQARKFKVLIMNIHQQVVYQKDIEPSGSQTYEVDVDFASSSKIKLVIKNNNDQLNRSSEMQNFAISNIYFTDPDVTL